eukprot:434033_1
MDDKVFQWIFDRVDISMRGNIKPAKFRSSFETEENIGILKQFVTTNSSSILWYFGQGDVLLCSVKIRDRPDLNMSVSYKESQMIHVLLGTEGSPIDSVNTNMCVSGFCRLDTNIPGHLRDSIAEIEEMVSVAKSHRIGMWRYGDCGSDDEI